MQHPLFFIENTSFFYGAKDKPETTGFHKAGKTFKLVY